MLRVLHSLYLLKTIVSTGNLIMFVLQTNSAYMLFYKRISVEERKKELEDMKSEIEEDDSHKCKVELTKDLAEVRVISVSIVNRMIVFL